MTYPSLYRQRSDLRVRIRKIKYIRESWKEYVELKEQEKLLTLELKRLAGIKPEGL